MSWVIIAVQLVKLMCTTELMVLCDEYQDFIFIPEEDAGTWNDIILND